MRAQDAFTREDERRAKATAEGQKPPRKRLPWFKLEVNQGAKVRFLWELTDGVGLWRHHRPTKPYAVSCFKNEEFSGDSGDDCPFCEASDRKSVEYFWMVYNYTTQQVEILSFKDTSFTPVGMLRSVYEDSQTVLDRDFTIRRQPQASRTDDGRQVTSYVAIPNAPSSFLVTGLSVPTPDELVEYLRPFELNK